MRKIIVILIVFIIFFISNLVFFNFSDNYRFFIKKIKNPEKVVYVKDKELLDEITNTKKEILTGSKVIVNTGKILPLDKKESISNSQVLLGEQYNKILEAFGKYNLGRLEILSNERLFDLTDEYPDEYYEYYSKDLTLYLFTTKSYNEVLDIFKVISSTSGAIFSINESNNFGDKSFYINLKGDEKEPQIRVIIGLKGLVFGLKFNKDQYNSVKQILSK